jgi:alkylation response protein AidB-like acyl-CoA dehydrogenase
MGWAGILVPEAHGGSDFGAFSLGFVLEELGARWPRCRCSAARWWR